MTEKIIKPTKKIIEFRKPYKIIELYGPERYLNNDLDSVFAENPSWSALNQDQAYNYMSTNAGQLLADLPFRYDERELDIENNLPLILERAESHKFDLMSYFEIYMSSKLDWFNLIKPVPELEKAVYKFYSVVHRLAYR